MNRTLLSLLLAFCVLITMTPALASETVSVNIDGKPQTYDQPATIINGRTMVPLRGIFETLGATVEWDNETQTVIASRDTLKDKITVKLTIGQQSAWVNGKKVVLDQAAVVLNGRTFVPVRFVGESLRADVLWKAETSTVEI